MRAAILLLVLGVLAAVAVWLLGGGAEPAPLGNEGAPPPQHAPAGPPAGRDPVPPPSPSSSTALATRAHAEAVIDTELADAPTACLLIVDHASGAPLAGASVRRLQSGAVIGFSDEKGLVELPLKQRDQLAVVADHYLLRLAPADIGTTTAEPQRIQLVRDRWSAHRRFEFTASGQLATGPVFVRFRPRDDQAKAARGGPDGQDAVLRRAWNEHTMLAAHASCADAPVQLGSYSEDRVLRLSSGVVVAFTSAGEFDIEAATENGFAARAALRIGADYAADRIEVVTVALERGSEVRGSVVGSRGEPLADATISVQGGEPLGLLASTTADGAFAIGPLAPGRLTLLVRHGDHEPLAFGPIDAAARDVRIALKALPKTTLRGRVRARPDLRPIANATVSWQLPGQKPIAARTEIDGTFRLPATGDIAARLLVSVPGYIALEELVAPGSPFADYDLLPATPEVRVEKGMSAMFAGLVTDAAGRPVAGTQVRWTPDAPAAAPGVPSRRTLSGGALDLPGTTTSGPDGEFRLETNAFGPGALGIAQAPSAQGLRLEAIAGATKQGLRLQR
ncbi:MAG: carboxypeptidase-like regulatory domain-containing protein [Planctomycetota bacterium]